MCDYSLEVFKSEKAAKDVTYKLETFNDASFGSKGFMTTPKATTMRADWCAACIPAGSMLRIEMPEAHQYAHGVTNLEDVVMVRMNEETRHGYHDGVRLENGAEVLLQTFPEGTQATVLVLGDAKAPEDRSLAAPAQSYDYDYVG